MYYSLYYLFTLFKKSILLRQRTFSNKTTSTTTYNSVLKVPTILHAYCFHCFFSPITTNSAKRFSFFFEIMFSIVDFHPNNTGDNLHYFSIICWPAVLNLYSFN